ncbi:MAG: hypothetical protein GX621_13950, partial [Pirellulaceae bacterium]|nr:hypothetical protein [Pirellulaceae bacterium]
MARLSRLSIAKPDIVALFRQSARKTYTTSDIKQILDQNRAGWRLSSSTTVSGFSRFLIESSDLRQEKIEFPYRPVVRFTWGDASTYSIIQSISASGYFTHYSAMHFHG